MKTYLVTYIETREVNKEIKAINLETAIGISEQIASQAGWKLKSVLETLDVNKFLCKEEI